MRAVRELVLAIPNLNGARYLEATLESLERNRPWARWYLQDGGSTDESLAIARRFASERDTIVSEPDRGQADALNRAFARMGGEVVGFLNSDDCLADGAAEAILEEFERHPDVDLIYGEVEIIDAEGTVLRVHRGDISSPAEICNIYDVWWRGRQWVQPEVFFRRRLWERVGPFDPRYQLAFDYDYWVRCFLAGAKIMSIPRVLARFRLHDRQKSCRAVEAADEIRCAVRTHLPALSRIAPWTAWKLRQRLSYDLFWSGQRLREGFPVRSFPRELLRTPGWLIVAEVRRRLRESFYRGLTRLPRLLVEA